VLSVASCAGGHSWGFTSHELPVYEHLFKLVVGVFGGRGMSKLNACGVPLASSISGFSSLTLTSG